MLIKYPQGNNLICDGPSKDIEYWFNAKLQAPITIETKKDPNWKPPYGGTINPSQRTYSNIQNMGNGWYKVVRKNALSCSGYNKPGRKSFPVKCVATMTDSKHRKSWPVHYYTVCILK